MQTVGLKGARLSLQQELLWSLMQEDMPYYCIQGTILLQGQSDVGALQRALQDIVDLHEIMHTVFYQLPGMDVPVQVVMKRVAITCPLISIEDMTAPLQDVLLAQHSIALRDQPFDLAHGPLVRAILFRFSEQKHILLLCVSALCADASSVMQIMAELVRLYTMESDHEQTASEEPLQYIDVAAWQNKVLASESTKGSYWSKIRLPYPLTIGLPFGGRERSEQSLLLNRASVFAPQRIVVPLDHEVARQIKAYVKQAGVSSSAFMFTCWKILLWRFTDEAEIVIGFACNGRIYEELSGALGLLTRFVPVPTTSSRKQIFSHTVTAIHKTLQEASKEQFYFTWDEVAGSENMPHFFPLAFEYNSVPAYRALPGALEISLLHLFSCTAPFALKLSVCEMQEGFQCEVHYNSNMISSEMVHQLVLAWQTVVDSAVKQPLAAVAALRIIPQQLEEHLLQIFRAPTGILPSSVFQQIFEVQVSRVPDQLALISGKEQITYHNLNCRANRLARVLRRYGVGPGQLVGLCVSRSVEMIIGLLAILKAGGAYVPLDPDSPSPRLIYQLRDIRAVLLLTQQIHLSLLSDWDGQILCLEAAAAAAIYESDTNLAVVNEPQDLAYVIYTSGSTGVPKGVMVQQRSLVNYTLELCKLVGQRPGLHFATVSTLAADLGNTAIFCALASGGSLQVLEYETITSGDKFTQWVAQHPIDVLKIVPSHLAVLLAHEQASTMLPRCSLILGGEALPFSLLKRLQELGGECTIFNHYGPTETTVGILINELGKASDLLNDIITPRSVPLGCPISNGEVYILDDEQQLIPIGVTGEIYVGGVGVAAGYLRQPEQTATHFVPHSFAQVPSARLYRTGDLARYTPEGAIEFMGRRDSQVKLHGYRIELSEIEIALRRHANVSDVVVLLHEDLPGKPLLVAYIVPRNWSLADNAELHDFLRTYVPSYMVPSAFVSLKALPLTANGKVDRQQLHAFRQEQNRLSEVSLQEKTAKPLVQPRDIIEFRLLQIWEEILQLRPISVVDNFFALGGYSMLAVRLVSQIFKQFGQDLTPATLFRSPTIASLAVVLRQQVASDNASALVAIQPDGAKSPFFCVHPAGGTVFCYTNLARYLGAEQPFYGLQFPQFFKDGDIVSSIEELANYDITAIQSVQAQGPYLIGGWSSGGVVAFEIAGQLLQKGHEVALLAIIDSTLPQQQVKVVMREAPVDGPLDLSDAALAQDVLRHFHIALPDTAFSQRDPADQLSYVLEKIIQANGAPADTTLEQLRYYARVRKTNTFIAHQYQPQRYPGRIHLVASRDGVVDFDAPEQGAELEQQKDRQIKSWTDIAEKGVELSIIPGTHEGLVEEPYVVTLATVLKQAIDSVLHR